MFYVRVNPMTVEIVKPVSAAERIEALMEIHPKGFDLSLEQISGLLDKLDNPQDRLPPVIHVAGTNGKGSTIAFTRAILEAAGLAVHVDTSPHLVNWHERNRIGRKGQPGRLVEDAVFSDAIRRVDEANGGQAITVFEVLTAVTFLLFSEAPADACLIEVGLGGRFDLTNVMSDVAVSVITPISIDHEAYLGDTLAKIAFEKAGIIKRETPVIIGPQAPEALATIEKQAARQRAPTLINGEAFSAIRENGRLVYHDETALLDLALPRLQGDHQIDNAATAIATARQFCAGQGIRLDNAMIDRGLQDAQWPGRMQHLTQGRLVDLAPADSDIWLDGGHNPGAAAMVARFMADLEERDPRPLMLICGMLNTKDPVGYFEQFRSLTERVITVPIYSSDAGISADELAGDAIKCGLMARSASSLGEALQHLTDQSPCRILIAGSLYLVGDALAENGTPPQ